MRPALLSPLSDDHHHPLWRRVAQAVQATASVADVVPSSRVIVLHLAQAPVVE
jgi:hypothetical protein